MNKVVRAARINTPLDSHFGSRGSTSDVAVVLSVVPPAGTPEKEPVESRARHTCSVSAYVCALPQGKCSGDSTHFEYSRDFFYFLSFLNHSCQYGTVRMSITFVPKSFFFLSRLFGK